MPARRVLSVGQCSADHASISYLLRTHFDAEVVPAATASAALDALRGQSFDLVLVNRVLDRDGSPGLDVIDAMKADERLRQVPVMLVSNYPDAQQQAEARGALPGFGKAALRQPSTLERLRALLG